MLLILIFKLLNYYFAMDEKEKLILKQYKAIIENRRFDELDILGFLIFIRRHIKNHHFILEFSDLIAHREREKGIIMDCISDAIKNNYMLIQGTNKVVGYHGIKYKHLERELYDIGKQFNIDLNNLIVREIILCIFALAQFTRYDNLKGEKGEVILIQGDDNSLALCTTEGKMDSYYIAFSILPGVKHLYNYSAGLIEYPVKTVRDKEYLYLADENQTLLLVLNDKEY